VRKSDKRENDNGDRRERPLHGVAGVESGLGAGLSSANIESSFDGRRSNVLPTRYEPNRLR
jgi:hypothetical protein